MIRLMQVSYLAHIFVCVCVCVKSFSCRFIQDSQIFHFQDEDGLLSWWRTVGGEFEEHEMQLICVIAALMIMCVLVLGWDEWSEMNRDDDAEQ